MAQFLRVEPQQVESVLRQMCEDGDAVLFGEEEAAAVYLPEYYDAERCVALALRETMRIPQHGGKSAAAAIRRLEAVNGIRYAPLQKQAIEKGAGRERAGAHRRAGHRQDDGCKRHAGRL